MDSSDKTNKHDLTKLYQKCDADHLLQFSDKNSVIRIQRNRGDKTPEVINFCKEHFAGICNEQIFDRKSIDLDTIFHFLNDNVDLLIAVSQFTEIYEIIVKFNQLSINQHLIQPIREIGNALSDKIDVLCDINGVNRNRLYRYIMDYVSNK